jgi:hypothetical protein
MVLMGRTEEPSSTLRAIDPCGCGRTRRLWASEVVQAERCSAGKRDATSFGRTLQMLGSPSARSESSTLGTSVVN